MTQDREVVTLTRNLELYPEFGTFGQIDTGRFSYPLLERPATGDHPCIPAGEYDVDWTDDGRHPKHNPCYEVMDVPGRTAILIHAANVYEELLGCLAPGTLVEEMSLTHEGVKINHMGVSGSGPALKAFCEDMKHQNFRLIIKEE